MCKLTFVFKHAFRCRNAVNSRLMYWRPRQLRRPCWDFPRRRLMKCWQPNQTTACCCPNPALCSWGGRSRITPTTPEDGDVLSTSNSPSYSPSYRPPTSPVSLPPSPELARVLDMAVWLARYCDADDDVTASFKPMETDDAVAIGIGGLGKRRGRLGLSAFTATCAATYRVNPDSANYM